MTSDMHKIFNAKGLPRCLHRTTRPNVPVPVKKRENNTLCTGIKSKLSCTKVSVIVKKVALYIIDKNISY